MKLRKKSGLTLGIIALSAAAITSVGFAAWVISQGDSQVANGQITVDTVQDKRFLIRALSEGNPTSTTIPVTYDSGSAIVFGWKDNETPISSPWLLHGDASMAENLGATIEFYVSNLDASKTGCTLTYTLSLTGESAAQTAFNSAVSNSYIGSIASETVIAETVSASETVSYDGMTWRKVTLDLTFSWGSHFGTPAQNPYIFYNTGKTAAEYGNDAKTALQAIEAASGVGFQVSITSAAA